MVRYGLELDPSPAGSLPVTATQIGIEQSPSHPSPEMLSPSSQASKSESRTPSPQKVQSSRHSFRAPAGAPGGSQVSPAWLRKPSPQVGPPATTEPTTRLPIEQINRIRTLFKRKLVSAIFDPRSVAAAKAGPR
jgi:hypothetical protein